MIGTGPFRLKSVHRTRARELVRFPGYWGGRPPLDGVVFTWYEGTAPQVLALRGGQIDLAVQLSAQEAAPFKNNSRFKVLHRAVRGAPDVRSCGSTATRSGTRECDAPSR